MLTVGAIPVPSVPVATRDSQRAWATSLANSIPSGQPSEPSAEEPVAVLAATTKIPMTTLLAALKDTGACQERQRGMVFSRKTRPTTLMRVTFEESTHDELQQPASAGKC